MTPVRLRKMEFAIRDVGRSAITGRRLVIMHCVGMTAYMGIVTVYMSFHMRTVNATRITSPQGCSSCRVRGSATAPSCCMTYLDTVDLTDPAMTTALPMLYLVWSKGSWVIKRTIALLLIILKCPADLLLLLLLAGLGAVGGPVGPPAHRLRVTFIRLWM